MPFPSKGKDVYSLSHVNYTHHDDLEESKEFYSLYDQPEKISRNYRSNYKYMINDAIRYFPDLDKIDYIDSIWEIKTTLKSSDQNDSRPIFFREDPLKRNLYTVLGGKIDNIFDLEIHLQKLFNHD